MWMVKVRILPPQPNSPIRLAKKSGQEEFDFEYGQDFAEHIEAFHPTFCKVLVRYNTEPSIRFLLFLSVT